MKYSWIQTSEASNPKTGIEPPSALDEVIEHSDGTYRQLPVAEARAELAQLRDDSLMLIGCNRLLDEVGAALNCAPDATILNRTGVLRADLHAAQARIAEFESGALVAALLDANRTQADRVLEQARQLDAARELLTTLEWNDWSDEVDAWLAANPAPQEPQT